MGQVFGGRNGLLKLGRSRVQIPVISGCKNLLGDQAVERRGIHRASRPRIERSASVTSIA